jgi:hypothetical protein
MIATLTYLSSLLLAAPAPGETPFDAGPRTKLIAPLLGEQTYLVVHIDVARFNEEAVAKAVLPLVPEDLRADLGDALQGFKKFQAAFTQAGGGELVVLFDVEELPNPSYVYVPLSEKADAAALTRLLHETLPLGRGIKVQKAGNLLAAGPEAALKRLGGRREPLAREGLAEALKAAGDTGAQVLLLPTRDQRRVIEEVVPRLPREFGGIPSKQLTRGLRWAALGLDAQPKPSLKLTVQCADATAAQTVNALMVAGVQALGNVTFKGEDKPVRELFPAEYAAVVKALRPEVKDDRLTVSVDDPVTLRAALARADDVMARLSGAVATRNEDNLRQLAAALHQYAGAHADSTLPANALYSSDGKPLLSWRVALLPYLGEEKLFKEFKLDEPWDGEHNKKLIDKMPDVFRSPRMRRKQPGLTTYLGPVGEHLVFTGGNQKVRMAQDIPDGTSNTICLVDAADDRAVVWTKPDDLKVDPEAPFKGLIGHYPGYFLAAFADGTVHPVPKNLPPATLWALFTRDGGEVVNWQKR